MGKLYGMKYRGTLLDFQRALLERAPGGFRDGKLHIVVPPGSGKRVLGLELIRILDAPALILARDAVSAQRWTDCFRAHFLREGTPAEEVLSGDLRAPGLLTAASYASLCSAPDAPDAVLAGLRRAGVRTLCLDEPYPLPPERREALERFLHGLGEMRTVTLSDAPPYDAAPEERDRCLSLFGGIAEELSAPELAARGILCPHQDYVYLNDPTEEEREALWERRARADRAVRELSRSDAFCRISDAVVSRCLRRDASLLLHAEEYLAVLSAANAAGLRNVPYRAQKFLSSFACPACTPETAARAFGFVCRFPEQFPEGSAAWLLGELQARRLTEDGRICLGRTEGMARILRFSRGKLSSAAELAENESAALGDSLRMLVLADECEETLRGAPAGMGEPFGAVSFYRSICARFSCRARPALFSETLTAVPEQALARIRVIAWEEGTSFTEHPAGTLGVELRFRDAGLPRFVSMTRALEEGCFQILVGTGALLRGWKPVCLNAVVLACLDGGAFETRKARGLAVRADARDPRKTVNIWHLATLEPPPAPPPRRDAVDSWYDEPEEAVERKAFSLDAPDFETLRRRFDCFLAPAYSQPEFESGFDRVDVVRPPLGPSDVVRLNAEMLRRANARGELRRTWSELLAGCPRARPVPNVLVSQKNISELRFDWTVRFRSLDSLLRHAAKGVLRPLQEQGAVGERARIVLTAGPGFLSRYCRLADAGRREQDAFARALTELLTPPGAGQKPRRKCRAHSLIVRLDRPPRCFRRLE